MELHILFFLINPNVLYLGGFRQQIEVFLHRVCRNSNNQLRSDTSVSECVGDTENFEHLRYTEDYK